ncbi:MAG TPA: hypothetical protein VK615_01010 [Candidatus Binatia bacterium]|nr:hypothetical protein [Candidatus Binatia bacterium]
MTLRRALLIGTAGFTVASLLVFGFWAFAGRAIYRSLGEGGFYAICAILFVAIGSLLLRSLTTLSLGRFALLFTGAFAAYAISWCAAWFLVRGGAGEWVGSFAGCLAFSLVVTAVFSSWRLLPLMIAVLFVGNAAGYFVGSYAYDVLRREYSLFSKLAWGLLYGLGTGAGIGYAFHTAEAKRGSVKPSSPTA